MHQRRVFVDLAKDCLDGRRIALDARNGKHLLQVLRLRAGAEVIASDRASGKSFQCQLAEDSASPALTIIAESPVLAASSRVASLCFAICKGDKNDFVCQKACELGVQRIILWRAEHSIAELKNSAHKIARWEKILEEAAKQAGQTRPPELIIAENCNQLINYLDDSIFQNDTKLCCSLSNAARPIRNIERSAAGVHLVIGPEGDLSAEEERSLVEAGFVLASLGPSRLRSETAAIAAVAMAHALWDYR